MCGEVARPVPAVRRLVVTRISFAQPIRATTNTAHDRSECARDLKRTALAVGYFGHTSPPNSLTPKSTSGIIAASFTNTFFPAAPPPTECVGANGRVLWPLSVDPLEQVKPWEFP